MNTQLINNIKETFTEKFNTECVLISSPGRINFIGGHTDYNEGFVLPAAIDKGIIAGIQKTENTFCTAFALNKEETFTFSLDDDLQPIKNGNWKNFIIGVIAEIEKLGIKIKPFNIVFGGDIPDGSGLSSSAALENSIVFGLNTIFDLQLTKHQMILISQKAEHNYVGVKCGIMDQYASMFGEENSVLYLDCRTQKATPIQLELGDYGLVLINSNVKHNLAEAAYNDRRSVCEKAAKMLHVPFLRDATLENLSTLKNKLSKEDYLKAAYIIEEIERTQFAAKALIENDLRKFGELLFKAHEGLRTKFKITCDELDFLIDKAKENPKVLGARMMGGGFGGCTINVVHKDELNNFIEEVTTTFHQKFNTKCSVEFIKLSQGTHQITKEILENEY